MIMSLSSFTSVHCEGRPVCPQLLPCTRVRPESVPASRIDPASEWPATRALRALSASPDSPVRRGAGSGPRGIPVKELAQFDADVRHDSGHVGGTDFGTGQSGDRGVPQTHDEAQERNGVSLDYPLWNRIDKAARMIT